VLTEKIARRGLHLTREYTTDPLEALFAHEVMTRNPVRDGAVLRDGFNNSPARPVVYTDHTLREVANILAHHNVTKALVVHRAPPHRLAGLITLDQLLHARRRDLHEEMHRERLLSVRRAVKRPPSTPEPRTP
jgi:hypothetical protein